MGQLAVKFKEWREKLEIAHEKAKYASQKEDPEQKSLTLGEENRTDKYGATTQTGEHEQEKQVGQQVLKKLETLESVMENQRKFIEDHDGKIQEIENLIKRFVEDQEEKEHEAKLDLQSYQGDMFDRLLGPIPEECEEDESRDVRKLIEYQAHILKNHEERLENNLTKIEIIREILEQEKGNQEKRLKQKLKEYEQQLKKRSESYTQLKKELEEQLELQQKLQDNLLAGFIVGFVIIVMICMLPKSLLASG